MGYREDRVAIPSGAHPWPHEIEAAKALASAGRLVEFIPETKGKQVKTADIQMDGNLWEIKSPESNSLRALQKNLRKALHQASRVVIDTRRMKGISDDLSEHELTKLSREFKSLKKLVLIRKDGTVVDIK